MKPIFRKEDFIITQKSTKREQLLLTISIISWLLLLVFELAEQFYWLIGMHAVSFPQFLQGGLLNVFLLSAYFYSSFKLRRHDSLDFHTLLYQVFIAAILSTFVSGFITLFIQFIKDTPLERNVFLRTTLFHIEFGLFIALLVRAYTKWRKMILYERTWFTSWSMKIFEVLLFSSLFEHFFHLDSDAEIYIRVAAGFLMLCALLLSVNVRWIPSLNFKQKIICLGYLLVILICISYFIFNINSYFSSENLVITELAKSVFYVALIGFVIIYAIASFLILIFNLPTSSVFEKKFKEIEAMQTLSADILSEESEYRAYHVLLSGALDTVRTDLAWVHTDKRDFVLSDTTPLTAAQRLTEFMREVGYTGTEILKVSSRKSKGKEQELYQSVVAAPLRSQNSYLGTLYMASRMTGYFDSTSISIIKTLTSQVSIALQNFRLLAQSRENERLKSELQIAYQVQQSLLPTNVDLPDHFEFFAHSIPATDVGGDYYDVYRVNDDLYALIIADVSGHGVQAAFVMAQLKGIFQSLVAQTSNPKDFLFHANTAISQCMRQNKKMYVTALYCLIDTKNQILTLARAGHCSALYYDNASKRITLLEEGGLGLGILRNEKYAAYINTEKRVYEEGDIILLYTDGLIETKNPHTQEEYGTERLHKLFKESISLPLSGIYENIMADVELFRGDAHAEDDCTLVIIKFA